MSVTRTADTDDDGTGSTGTIRDNAWKTAIWDAVDGRWSEFSTTSTGNQDNFPYSEADVLRCNNATTITLRGLLAPAAPVKPGKRLILVSVGAGSVVLNDQDANSTAANRIITGAAAAITLTAGTGWAWVEYDSTTARWRVVGSSAALTVANGGTGAATLTAHGVVIGEGTSAVAVTSAGTASQVLTSNGASADPTFQGPVVQTTTSTGTQNDFALTAGATVLRCNNATLLTLTGFAAGYDGQRLTLVSIGAGQVDLAHQNASSTTAADRLINFATAANSSLAAGAGTAHYVYDATTARWRMVTHDQGDWITPTFAAGDYTASAGNWTVAAATTHKYWLRGRVLTHAWAISGTTSGTPVSVYILTPGGFVPTSLNGIYYVGANGAGVAEAGYFETLGGAGKLALQRFGNVAFAAGTVTVYGCIDCPVA